MIDLSKEHLCETLRKQRKSRKLSVETLSALLKERGIHIAPKTIYNWESGQSKPSITVLFALMDIYDIPGLLNELKTYDPDNSSSSELWLEEPTTAYINSSGGENDFTYTLADKRPDSRESKPKSSPSWGNLSTPEEGRRFLEAVMRLPESARRDISLMAEFVIDKNSRGYS